MDEGIVIPKIDSTKVAGKLSIETKRFLERIIVRRESEMVIRDSELTEG